VEAASTRNEDTMAETIEDLKKRLKITTRIVEVDGRLERIISKKDMLQLLREVGTPKAMEMAREISDKWPDTV
jgi:hypothetical protein